MFKLTYNDIPALAIAAVLVALGILFDLIDLDISHLIGNALLVVSAATVGVLLGRRSDTANAFADTWSARAKAAEAKLREHGIILPK